MKVIITFLAVFAATLAYAEDGKENSKLSSPAQLAKTTSAYLGAVSAMLSKQSAEVNRMIDERTDAIAARERAALTAQNRVKSEIEHYNMTRSNVLADSLQSMIRRSDRVATEPADLTSAEAALRSEIKVATALPLLSTDKLDSAAKKLAVLAEQQPPLERAQEAIEFYNATKASVNKIEKDAEATKLKADEESKKAILPTT
ncbi:hypothetical protein [Janthinobacterium tructae]|uniref:DUF4398 domain-containing protein n=1 Tax=Janthinobacterium tructae TaxID=2590869 RepID=A0A4Y6RB64_9BURK|nr:hypothetical protein [Janthinobacterium tructae]QDG70248.1 hypothetical protein FJQ89_07335 [Janthinobacterium tructae]